MSGAVGSKPTLIVSGLPRWSFAFRSFFSIRSTAPLARKASCSSRVMGVICNRDLNPQMRPGTRRSEGPTGEDELHDASLGEGVEVVDGYRGQASLTQGGNDLAARPGALLVRFPDHGSFAVGKHGPPGDHSVAAFPGTGVSRGDLQVEGLAAFDERLLHSPD